MDIGVQGERSLRSAHRHPGRERARHRRPGKIVIPGGIEPHAHIDIPVPELWAGKPEVMTQPPERQAGPPRSGV